jgi:hypothetical protein
MLAVARDPMRTSVESPVCLRVPVPDTSRTWFCGDTSSRSRTRTRGRAGGNLLTGVTSATGRYNEGRPHRLLYPTASLAEQLQAALLESRVVKTLNTMLAPVTGASAIRFS